MNRARRTPTRRVLAACAACAALGCVALAAWVAVPLPRAVTDPAAVPGVTLEDRHGIVLRTTRAADGSRARWLALDEMDPELITAFVAAEDRRFYQHGAIDVRALLRAARDNLLALRVVSGASTITMQTARLVRAGAGRPLSERGWRAKVDQTLWALRLEAHLTKQQILEQYLNRVPLGQGAVGVGAASALYFGTSARELSLGQAAALAGLARAPSRDNPLVSSRRARSRRAFVLARMRRAGYASAADSALAAIEPFRPVDGARGAPFHAPHFTTRVLTWMTSDSTPPDGLVSTSLDLALQMELEGEVRRALGELRDRGARHAAAVVLHNRTGDILAWVGSPDFWADTAGQTDMVISARQPGSALKPFLYGLAFDRGHTPATILADVARTYHTSSGPYRPRNYDRRFHGPVRAREALASSYNVPAVELADAVGAASLLQTLRSAGFTSLERSAEHYGLGLALGNGDVTLLELANGYRALANGGVWRPYRWRARGASAASAARGPERRVVSERAAAQVLHILQDADARVSGFGLATPFDFPFPAAAKTGTSRHFTDNWAVVTTEGFTVAVWVGNFSGRPMDGVSGVSGAGPLVRRAVLRTAARYAPGALATPEEVGLVPVAICRISGKRASHDCPHALEWFVPGREPDGECDWHRGGVLTLPVRFAEWVAEQRDPQIRVAAGADVAVSAARPSATVRVASRRDGPAADVDDARFRILSPRDGDGYEVPPGVDSGYATIALRATGGASFRGVRWFVDGAPAASRRFRLVRGTHTIRAQSAGGEVDAVTIVVR